MGHLDVQMRSVAGDRRSRCSVAFARGHERWPHLAGVVVAACGGTGWCGKLLEHSLTSALQPYWLATLPIHLPYDVVKIAGTRDAVIRDKSALEGHLVEMLHGIERNPELAGLPIGLLGLGACADAVLAVAADHAATVAAVVCCGGAWTGVAASLARVQSPTMVIVAGADREGLIASQSVLRALSCKKRLEVVPGSGECFDSPGAPESVSCLASCWLGRYLGARAMVRAGSSERASA